jgi:RNA 3'-terminal phosphate cyclase (ATP)
MGMIQIDGSMGEGGGQVLRSALTLSALTGQSFEITRIRAGRQKPGLLRQHLTAVQATAEVCGAKVVGDQIGSLQLRFEPGQVRSGAFNFAVGSAGSGVLVLHTLLPLWMQGRGVAELTVEGGTHNRMAPPYDHLERCWLPAIRRLGVDIEMHLERHGFYPAGGGRIHVKISGVPALKTWDWVERGPIEARDVRILLAHLPDSLGNRQASLVAKQLGWDPSQVETVRCDGSVGPGNAIVASLSSAFTCEVVTGFGSVGVPTPKVVGDVVNGVRRYLKSTAPVGEHFADQLMIPFALAGSGSYRAVNTSLHAQTNAAVIEAFLPGNVRLDPDPTDGTWFRFSNKSGSAT